MAAGRVRRAPGAIPPLHRGPALHMKALARRTGAVLRLWHQAARRARMAPIWRMASAVTAGRGVRPGWRSDVVRHPTRRAAPQLVHVQPLAAVIRRLGDFGRHRVRLVIAKAARPPYHRATPATAPPPSHDPPDRANPATARPVSRPLVTANSAAAQFWAAMQLDRPSCASMLPHRVRSEPCKVLVALPCAPV
jgi:hypothetical protein